MASATSRGLAVVQRVVAAHDALQFGELADHAGDEVGLGQLRGALGQRRRRRRPAGRWSRPGAASRRTRSPWLPSLAWNVTLSSSGTRASRRVLRSRSQKCRASAKRARSTRSLPAMIAAPPSSASMLATKANQGAALAVRRAQGEIALVHPHRDLHDLGRQVHVLVVDAAEQRHRPFDQAGDLVEQAGIVDHGQALVRGEAGDPLGDDALALVGIDQTRGARAASPASRRAQVTANAPGAWKRWPSVRSALARPWPSSSPSRRSNGTTSPSSRQMMRRSGRTQMKLLRAAPAHGFRPGEAAQQRRAWRRRSSSAAPIAAAALFQHPVVALLAQAARGRAMLAQEAGQRLLRRVGARAALDAAGCRDARGDLGRAARSGAGRRRSRIDGGVSGASASVIRRARSSAARALHPRGDFLAEQFEEEFGHVSPSAPVRCRFGKSLPLNSRGSPEDLRQRIGEAVAEIQGAPGDFPGQKLRHA